MILIVIALICTIFLLSFLIVCITKIFSDFSYGCGPDGNVIAVYSFIFSFVIFVLLLFQLDKPKAIDVYKGKTTLGITYKDRVPVDSTVVWKNR